MRSLVATGLVLARGRSAYGFPWQRGAGDRGDLNLNLCTTSRSFRSNSCSQNPAATFFAASRPPQLHRRASLQRVTELRALASAQAAAATRGRGWSWNLFTWCAVVGFLELCWRGGSSGAVLSAVVGLLKLRSLLRRGSVHAERGSMAHFALRGATLGVVLSLGHERNPKRVYGPYTFIGTIVVGAR